MMLLKPKTEAQELFKEAFPFPSVFTALAVLATGAKRADARCHTGLLRA